MFKNKTLFKKEFFLGDLKVEARFSLVLLLLIF
jgi:hypothetical protein